MKKSNIILTIQLIVMYIIHSPFYLCLILARLPFPLFDFIWILLKIGFFLFFLMIPVIIASFIIAVLQLIKGDSSPIDKTVKVKLFLIPWYILNFLVCFLLVAGFLNPWLFMAVPLLICIEILITYIFMISTSIHTIAYVIHNVLAKKIKITSKVFIGIIMCFLFCLDIIGCFMIQSEIKKQEQEIKIEKGILESND